jgi:hypothetical protein
MGILSIIDLWIWFFYDIFLISKIIIFHMILIFDTFNTLSLGIIKEYFINTFFIIDNKWFHTLCINKALWSFTFNTFVTFVAYIRFIAFWYIILSFIWEVIISTYLFWGSIKLLFFIILDLINIFHVIFNILSIFCVVRHIFYWLFILILILYFIILILNILFILLLIFLFHFKLFQ